jgi:hypothetical protein
MVVALASLEKCAVCRVIVDKSGHCGAAWTHNVRESHDSNVRRRHAASSRSPLTTATDKTIATVTHCCAHHKALNRMPGCQKMF